VFGKPVGQLQHSPELEDELDEELELDEEEELEELEVAVQYGNVQFPVLLQHLKVPSSVQLTLGCVDGHVGGI